MAVKSFQELDVWIDAMKLVKEVYRLTRLLPASERFGLISQMQRAAVSIPANIAEGAGRDYTLEFLRHLSIAQGSLAELETYFLLTISLGYVSNDELKDANQLTYAVGRRLSGLQRSLRRKVNATE